MPGGVVLAARSRAVTLKRAKNYHDVYSLIQNSLAELGGIYLVIYARCFAAAGCWSAPCDVASDYSVDGLSLNAPWFSALGFLLRVWTVRLWLKPYRGIGRLELSKSRSPHTKTLYI